MYLLTLIHIYIYILIAIKFIAIIFFILFISLECKYNRLQFGIRIGSIYGSIQMLQMLCCAMFTTTFTPKKSIPECPLSQEQRGSERNPESIAACAVFLSRRSFRNSSGKKKKNLQGTALTIIGQYITLDTETEGSTTVINLRASGCTDSSAVRTLLRCPTRVEFIMP